jgi:hypothetical protein
MKYDFFDFDVDDEMAVLAILEQEAQARSGGGQFGVFNMFLNYSTITNVVNTTTETSLLGSPDAGSTKTVSGGFVSVGRTFEMYLAGVMGWTGAPTLNVRIKLGGAAGVLLHNFTPILPAVVNGTAWRIYAMFTITAIGAGGNLYIVASQFEFVTGGADGPAQWSGRGTNNAAIDFTSPRDWAATAQWGTADPANFFTYTFGCINVVR